MGKIKKEQMHVEYSFCYYGDNESFHFLWKKYDLFSLKSQKDNL